MKEKLRRISVKEEGSGSFLEFIYDKKNAKLGDSLVNFIYSLAKSIVLEILTGMKVSDLILSEAYRGSLWYKTNTLKLTGKKGRIADVIEALILYFWLYKDLDLENLVEPLINELKSDSLHHPKEEQTSAVLSFQRLLDYLFQLHSIQE